jgi:hypothetical protein
MTDKESIKELQAALESQKTDWNTLLQVMQERSLVRVREHVEFREKTRLDEMTRLFFLLGGLPVAAGVLINIFFALSGGLSAAYANLGTEEVSDWIATAITLLAVGAMVSACGLLSYYDDKVKRKQRKRNHQRALLLEVPSQVRYKAKIVQSAHHAGGVIEVARETLKTAFAGQEQEGDWYSTRVAEIPLPVCDIEEMTKALSEVNQALAIQEQQENAAREKALKAAGLDDHTYKVTQAKLIEQMQAIREVNFVNAGAIDAVNEQAEYEMQQLQEGMLSTQAQVAKTNS